MNTVSTYRYGPALALVDSQSDKNSSFDSRKKEKGEEERRGLHRKHQRTIITASSVTSHTNPNLDISSLNIRLVFCNLGFTQRANPIIVETDSLSSAIPRIEVDLQKEEFKSQAGRSEFTSPDGPASYNTALNASGCLEYKRMGSGQAMTTSPRRMLVGSPHEGLAFVYYVC